MFYYVTGFISAACWWSDFVASGNMYVIIASFSVELAGRSWATSSALHSDTNFRIFEHDEK